MPTFIVTAPDGKKIRVTAPEGASEAQAVAMARRQYKAPVKAPQGRGGFGDTLKAADVGKGIPFVDEAAAALYALPGAAIDAAKGRGFDPGVAYNRMLNTQVEQKAYDRNNAPVASAVGEIAGGVGTSLALPGGTATTLGKGLANSGLYGLLYGASENKDDRLMGGAKGAASAVTGDLIGRGVLKGAGKVLKGATRLPEAELLRKAGVRTTIGQELGGRAKQAEDVLSGYAMAGSGAREMRRRSITDLNRAMADEALSDIGAKTSPASMPGREVIDDMASKAEDAYSAALGGINAKIDKRFTTRLRQSRADPVVASLIDDEIVPRIGGGNVDGRSIQEIKEILDSEISLYKRAPGQRAVAQKLRALRDEVMGLVDRSGGGPAYRAARSSYGKSQTVLKASAKSTTDGIATPRQFGMAIREGANRYGAKGAYGRGMAPMQGLADAGASVLPSVVPDSGTAGRSAAMNTLVNPIKWPGAVAAQAPNLFYTPAGQAALRKLIIERPDIARQLGLLGEQLAAPAGLLTGVAGAQGVQ